MVVGVDTVTGNNTYASWPATRVEMWRSALEKKNIPLSTPYKEDKKEYENERIIVVYHNTHYDKIMTIVKFIGYDEDENLHYDPFNTACFQTGQLLLKWCNLCL